MTASNNQTVTANINGLTDASRWAILVLMFFLQTSASLVTLAFGPLAPFLQNDFNISRAQVGLYTSLVFTGSILLGAICGWLIDKFHVRFFLFFGPAMLGLFFLVLSQTPYFEITLFFTFIGGIGYAFVNPTAAKALTNWFPPQSRATAIGIMKSGVTVGGAAGAVMLPTLALMIGWRFALATIAAAVIVLGVISIILYREPANKVAIDSPVTSLKALPKILTNRNILLLAGLCAIYSGTQLSIATYLVLFLKEAINLSVVTAGTFLTISTLSGVVGRILWGFISDKVFGGRRKTTLSLAGLITAVMALLIAFFFAVVPLWLLCVIIAVLGLSGFGWPSVFITFLAEIGGEDQAATAVGVGVSISNLGILIGPPLFGHIVDITQSYTFAWSVFGFCIAAAASLIFMIRE